MVKLNGVVTQTSQPEISSNGQCGPTVNGIAKETELQNTERGISNGGAMEWNDKEIFSNGDIKSLENVMFADANIQSTDRKINVNDVIQLVEKERFNENLQHDRKIITSEFQDSNKGNSEDKIDPANQEDPSEGVLTVQETPDIAPFIECKETAPVVPSITQRFKYLSKYYSTITSSFVPKWKTDNNLSPPKSFTQEIPERDTLVVDYYNSLQYTLFETGCPETVDRTDNPCTTPSDEQVTVAIMASPCECIGLLLQGGNKTPGAFHLILSTSWLSKEPSSATTGQTQNQTSNGEAGPSSNLKTVFVHKAIRFFKNGQTFIDEFAVPRKATYFLNFFTHTITGGQRNDGMEFEDGIDCPMSSPVPLAATIDDKVWTRNIMAEVGMPIPETLAFKYHPRMADTSSTDALKIVNLYDKENVNLEEYVGEFLNGERMSRANKVVVKPSGPGIYGSIGVSFHKPHDVTSVCEAVRALLREINPGSSILVERFIDTLNRYPKDGHLKPVPWEASERYGFRMRATVCRGFNDVPVTTMVNCGIGIKSEPINGGNTVSQSVNSTLMAFGVVDILERHRFEERVRQHCADLMRGIIQKEKLLSSDIRGAVHGQTDIIGVDICVEDHDGQLVPYGIEVNSHDCIINCQVYDFIQALYKRTVSSTKFLGSYVFPGKPHDLTKTYQPWIETMVVRSQLYMMQGKVILVIGAGGHSKRFIWTAAAQYGVKIVLVDYALDNRVKEMVQQFVSYDFHDQTLDEDHARGIASTLQNLGINPDGCLTFWEDCGPLAALIREELDLGNGPSYEAALNGKKKSRTQEILRSRQDDTPHWPRTYLYSTPTYHLDDQTVESFAERIRYPVILKLEHGSSAVGVSLVHNATELVQEYKKTTSSLQREADFPGIGLGHDNSMAAMEYIQGPEHDVDVVIFDRQLVAAFISDNGPTRVPLFTETTAVMPSTLPEDKQAQLVAAAYQCCTEIGLTHGTFNVELRMTQYGPKLIEINARMGGFYNRDWIRRLYNVDLVLLSMMVACGIKPFVPKCPPKFYMMGVMLLPSLHKDVLASEAARELINSEEIIVNEFSEKPHESDSDLFEEPFAQIAVKGQSVPETKDNLIKVCEKLGITCENYNVEELLEEFL